MRILMIAVNDPAGTAIEFTKAINKYTEYSCRLITKEIRYNFMFEKDLHLPWLEKDDWDEVEHLLKNSDVFHFHMTADEYTSLGPFRPVEYIKGKMIFHHHHGHPDFRANPEKYRWKYKQRRRRNLLVSTPDLLRLLPEATWQPNLVPIDDPLYMPLEDKPDEPIIFCHSPTRRDLKNTQDFIQAVKELKKDSNVPIELRLIENTPHKESLQLKRESHILFDHLQGYYGVSSLEGLSQGLSVIAGLDKWNKRHIKEFTGTSELPWIDMGLHNMVLQLKALFRDTKLFSRKNDHSRQFMEKFWCEERILQPLIKLYSQQIT